jgi:hypothetical protein
MLPIRQKQIERQEFYYDSPDKIILPFFSVVRA